MTIPNHGLMTVEQVADYLQCTTSQVERFIRLGELERVPLSIREAGKGPQGPKCWRIRPAALAEFISARKGFEPQPLCPEKPEVPLVVPALSGSSQVTGSDGKKRLKI